MDDEVTTTTRKHRSVRDDVEKVLAEYGPPIAATAGGLALGALAGRKLRRFINGRRLSKEAIRVVRRNDEIHQRFRDPATRYRKSGR